MSNPISERTRQRRRILRVAAGAPIVLTLPSGAALAAASVGCDVKSLNNFNPNNVEGFAPVSGDKSSWMRIELPKLLMREGNDGGGPSATGRVPGFLFNGTYYKVENDAATVFEPNQSGGNAPTATDEFYYALVDYQDGVGFLTLDKNDGNVNPIAGVSCWNSLTGAQLQDNVIN
ncbi:hypothetical protein ACKVEX_02585 [Rhodocyclaceae bacterium SMB388]